MDSTKTFLKEHLPPRQIQLLTAIEDFQQSRCFSPTITELADQLAISRSTIFEHLEQLRKKGFLSGTPCRARSLTLASKAYKLLSKTADSSKSQASLVCQTKGEQAEDEIPLAGRVAAGVPIEAIENKESVSFKNLFSCSGEIFALEVRGDSMIEEGIDSGDYVICRKSSTADDGQLVVAIVDEEKATLKRFYREKDTVRLQPANENYFPFYSQNCRIEAVVIGLIKRF